MELTNKLGAYRSKCLERSRLNQKPQESMIFEVQTNWRLRYSLFSLFDKGIMVDEDSLLSVCPEVVAQHMANRCSYGTVLDPFCGAGGNAIKLALTCTHVIAMDIDPKKVALAKKNAEIYGVADRIFFMVGDFFQIADDLKVDAVVTSPPWGGPDYIMEEEFDTRDLCSRGSGGMAAILQKLRAVAPRVVLRVPESVDEFQCVQMAMAEGFSHVEFESVTIDGKRNCINLYLTRNDTCVKGAPVQSWSEALLITPPLLKRQRVKLICHDQKYSAYFENVSRFLDA